MMPSAAGPKVPLDFSDWSLDEIQTLKNRLLDEHPELAYLAERRKAA
jgi:hypothetical protein